MKQSWFVAGLGCLITYALLRIYTGNLANPAWAAHLRLVALLAALVCLRFSGPMPTGADMARLYQRDYERKWQSSFIVGAVCLILIPIGIWVLYARYYGPLIAASYN